MTDKELKRLTKREMLELMLEQQQEIERLEAELKEAKEKLEDRTIRLSKVGSIAKASLELTNVFEEAQKAANLYLENVMRSVTPEAIARANREE